MTNSLEALFCHVDDFWKIFEPKWRQIAPFWWTWNGRFITYPRL